MSLIKYDPLALRRRTLFNDFFTRGISQPIGNDQLISQPSVNIVEMPEQFKLELAVPGLSKEDIKMSLEKNQIEISAEKKEDKTTENSRFTRREFNFSSFKRNFLIPKTVDKNRIEASYENGILTVSLFKREEDIDHGVKTIDIA